MSMKIVEDERLPADRSIQYVNLALADFKLDYCHAQEKFVEAVREGVDNVYTSQTCKIECEAIPKLVKERRLVVISGAPGVGKSTLARKVCQDICNSPGCGGYILVLLVELRDLLLFKKDFKLVDILQLFEEKMGDTTSPVELSKAIYGNQGKDVLFVLDGFDELPPHLRQSDFLVNLLSHSRDSPLRDCDVVLTSRSIVTSEIYHQMQQSRPQVTLANIEVLGFTQDQIKEYAGQYFADEGQPGLLDSFVSKIDAIPQIRGLCSIPVVLSIICEVFVFVGDLPPTLTQIYNEYLCVKVLKYCKDLSTLDSILDLPRDHDIYKLGEIAYNCILSQKVVFDSADLQGLGEHFSDRERGCGVLTARPVRAGPKSKKAAIESFFFIHLTVQEFIAAVFVALLPAEMQRKIWAKYLGKPHMAQVWRFYCGLTKLKHFQILRDKITAYPKDFQMQCLFECQDASLVCQLMPRIIGEEVEVKPNTAYDSTAYGYCLSKHPALKWLTINSLMCGGSAEIHRLLEPVYASGTLQTLILPDGSDWREIEVTLDRLVSQEREASTGDSQKDGALKGHFGKVALLVPPVSVAVKVLCLQHVREVECWRIQGCEAMDPEVLREMEKALEGNRTLEKLTLTDGLGVTVPKEFCRRVLFGTRRSTSLSDVHLDFRPPNWDCPGDVPADAQGSMQHVTLLNVPVNVLPKLWSWLSQVKQLECRCICPPQERGVREESTLNEVEQTLSGMGRLEKLVLEIGFDWPDSLLWTFGLSVLKSIAKNQHIREFVLYDWSERDNVLHNMLGRLKPHQRTMFTTGRYDSSPCILLSASACDVATDGDGSATDCSEDGDSSPLSPSIVGQEQVDSSPQTYPTLLLQDTQGVSGAGKRQEYMASPTAAAPHVRGHPPGDMGYVLPPPRWAILSPTQSLPPRLMFHDPSVVRSHNVGQYQAFPPPRWALLQPFRPRQMSTDPSGVRYHPHSVGQNRVLSPLGWDPPQPFPPRRMFPDPSGVRYYPHSVGQHQAFPPPRWALLQPFPPRQMFTDPSGVRYHPHSVGQHQVLPPLGWAPPQPFPPRQMFPDPPSGVRYHPHSVGQHQGALHSFWDAPGPSRITAPPPPAPPTSIVEAPTPLTQPYIAVCDSPGPSERGAHLLTSCDLPGPSGITPAPPPPAPPTSASALTPRRRPAGPLTSEPHRSKRVRSGRGGGGQR